MATINEIKELASAGVLVNRQLTREHIYILVVGARATAHGRFVCSTHACMHAQVHAALSSHLEAAGGQHGGQQQHCMGKEKAAQLLAQLPEDAVQKLLALVQQGGSPRQQQA